MGNAKQIKVTPIKADKAHRFVRSHHYSGTSVRNSQLHFGVWYNGRVEGVLQLGPPMMKRSLLPLVEGTAWNGMLELNRMVFTDNLPRNSESRAIGIVMRTIRKHYPHIEWVVSFADATQCGDGTIYRASGFVLTQIKRNNGIIRLPDGTVSTRMTMGKGRHIRQTGAARPPEGSVALDGYQLRYIYFLNPDARSRLTVPEVPYSEIERQGASMYRGVSGR